MEKFNLYSPTGAGCDNETLGEIPSAAGEIASIRDIQEAIIAARVLNLHLDGLVVTRANQRNSINVESSQRAE